MEGTTPLMSPREFLDSGFLHEINRLLLHPNGLALSITMHDELDSFVASVIDWREDDEGVYLGDDLLSATKAEKVAAQTLERRAARKELLGYVIQPVETDKPTLTTTYVDPAERTSGGKPVKTSVPGVGEVEFER